MLTQDQRFHSEALTYDDDIDAENIEVSVKDCEVTLSGTVDSRFVKRMAEDIALGVSGVTDVNNQIRVQKQGDSERETTSSSRGAERATVGSGKKS